MSWLIGWGVLSVGVVVGFLLAALLRANGRDVPVPSRCRLLWAYIARLARVCRRSRTHL